MKKFQRYKDTRKDLKAKLYPSFPLRDWNDITEEEKSLILKHFLKLEWFTVDVILETSLNTLQDTYKRVDFGFLEDPDCFWFREYQEKYEERKFKQFKKFFCKMGTFYLLEFLSIYINELIDENEDEKDNLKKNRHKEFLRNLDKIFSDFGINITIHNLQFIPRQSEEIVEKIYKPVLDSLQAIEYKAINAELSRAFNSFHKKDYNDVITKSMNAIQAYLQIVIHGKVTKKKNISDLLKEAENKKLIPNSDFVSDIYKRISGFLEKQRKNKAGVHPTDGKANQDEALLVLNLSMVLLQSFFNI